MFGPSGGKLTCCQLLTETSMTDRQYTIALMVFLIAYTVFEVPSNYMLKRLSPSTWIAFLMLSWGAITVGLGGTRSYGAVTISRLLLGSVEAGLFPGLVCTSFSSFPHPCHFSWNGRRLPNVLVPSRRAIDSGRTDTGFSNIGRSIWWCDRVRRRSYEQSGWTIRMEVRSRPTLRFMHAC
jgi:hypothetical protein